MGKMTTDMYFTVQHAFPHIFDFYVSEDVSEATLRYNCIAWAYGIDTHRLWPNQYGFYWPPGITNTKELSSFIELFESIGYLVCEHGEFEAGFNKIAIFVNEENIPTHAARQLPDKKWTSKLGVDIDICHTIEGMVGGLYGTVSVYMKRTI